MTRPLAYTRLKRCSASAVSVPLQRASFVTTRRRAATARATATRRAPHDAPPLVLLHDVQLLLDDFVRGVELCAAAVRARVGSEARLLRLGVRRQRSSSRRPVRLFSLAGSSFLVGGCGRSSKERFAASLRGGGDGSGDGAAGGRRCLRCAAANSSAMRSFIFASCSVSCATTALKCVVVDASRSLSCTMIVRSSAFS